MCSSLTGLMMDGVTEERDRFRRDPRAPDEDEELWFEDEQELEQETATLSAASPQTPTASSLSPIPSTSMPQTPPPTIGEARTPAEATEQLAPTYVGTPRPQQPPRPLTPLVDSLQQKQVRCCVVLSWFQPSSNVYIRTLWTLCL